MVKSSFKFILWNEPNDKGQFPIYLKIYISKVTRYVSTGKYIDKKLWDEKRETVKPGHSSADIWNVEFGRVKNSAGKRVIDLSNDGLPVSADIIKQFLTTSQGTSNFFAFVADFCEQVKHKREPATVENYRKHSLKLELFHGSKNLSFEQIDQHYLRRFEVAMSQGDKDNTGVGNNYIHSVLKTIRMFFNAAIKQGITTSYPFNQFEIPEYEAPGKAYLSISELGRIEEYAEKETNNTLKQTAVYFLFGCYTGLRISDWIKFNQEEHLHENQIRLRTKKNGEYVAMPISSPLRRILKLVKGLPLTIEEPTLNKKLKVIARHKDVKIKKKLTSHVGRHTFAITLCAEQGMSSETCAELMGITIDTCVNNYYKVTKKKIYDETMRAWNDLK